MLGDLRSGAAKMLNRRLALGFGGWLEAYESAKRGDTTEAALVRVGALRG